MRNQRGKVWCILTSFQLNPWRYFRFRAFRVLVSFRKKLRSCDTTLTTINTLAKKNESAHEIWRRDDMSSWHSPLPAVVSPPSPLPPPLRGSRDISRNIKLKIYTCRKIDKSELPITVAYFMLGKDRCSMLHQIRALYVESIFANLHLYRVFLEDA